MSDPILDLPSATRAEIAAGLSVEARATANPQGERRRRFNVSEFAGVTDGLGAKRILRATFDPSANINHRTVAAHGLGVSLPDNAIITGYIVDVVTTFTSATDAATIALKAEGTGDLLAAIAISDSTNMWDAGIHAGKPGYPSLGADAAHDTQPEVAALFAASFVKTTAVREITATVAVEALTAGKAVIFVEYIIGA